ncbi:mechanosensitive ion channel family protein [Gallaecimonas sp. GXIMD4217]|uniref:mechanosensitive ion channel family protein n=1 Tax=Gallaecimonas sp. GXIMD4217 TaxID=3131927 RepID=UPI00311B0D58
MLSQELNQITKITDIVIDYLVNYGFQLLGALVILLLGLLLARSLGNTMKRLGEKRHWDPTLAQFLSNLVRLLVLGLFIIIAAGKLGLTISPLIAAIGAATFGLSLALQGPVSNYGSGLALILTRPFVVGDTITILDRDGVVEQITLAQTVLVTEDGERIHIPNRQVLGEIFHNSKENKLAETLLLLPAQAEPARAIALLKAELEKHPELATEPAPQVGIDAFTPLGVRIGVRLWLPTARYHEARYGINLALYQVLSQAGMAPASHGGAVAVQQADI